MLLLRLKEMWRGWMLMSKGMVKKMSRLRVIL
jgi:hypothetical protein